MEPLPTSLDRFHIFEQEMLCSHIQDILYMFQLYRCSNLFLNTNQDSKDMGVKDVCPTFFTGVDVQLHTIFTVKCCLQTWNGHERISKLKYFVPNENFSQTLPFLSSTLGWPS